MISESEFTVKGHGVHTAYIETVNGLEKAGIDVLSNSSESGDIRHIHTVGFYALLQFFKPGKKVISAHLLPESFLGSLVAAKYWLFAAKGYLRWFYNRADLVIAVSEFTKQELLKIGVKKPIVTITNMVDTTRFSEKKKDKSILREKYGYKPDDWIIVGNGQVQPRKRVDTFLRLADELPSFQFLWIGGIPFKKLASESERMEQSMESSPSNCKFTGVVPLEQVPDYYAMADVFFLPSEQETFCIAVIEGAASGLPVVLRNISDYDFTFKGDALLGDESEFKSILTSLKEDPALYAKYQKRAENIARRYDAAATTQNLIRAYETLLKHSPSEVQGKFDAEFD